MKKLLAALTALTLAVLCLTLSGAVALGSDLTPTLASRPVLTATSQPGGVLLEWDRPAGNGVVGYLVHRSTESGRRGMWPVSDFPVYGISYLDLNVNPGETYYYTIIPLLPSGKWAKASREVTAQAGALPNGEAIAREVAAVRVSTPEGMATQPLMHEALYYRGRVLLALEDLVSITGARLVYHPTGGSITHKLPSGRVYEMKVGVDALLFYKAAVHDTCSPILQDGQVYLPVRWIVEAMEGEVTFDPLTRVVMIQLPATE